MAERNEHFDRAALERAEDERAFDVAAGDLLRLVPKREAEGGSWNRDEAVLVALIVRSSKLLTARRRSWSGVYATPATQSLTPTLPPRSAKQTQRGARIAHAGGRQPSKRIDAVIALAMAVDRAEHQPEPAKLIGWL